MGISSAIPGPNWVALPTEGVDRNFSRQTPRPTPPRVALPTEGVDRNESNYQALILTAQVALPTEGVDRNSALWTDLSVGNCRPPHGGRG